jgi:predicted lipoprotein with Yx(FWY)xxD motif
MYSTLKKIFAPLALIAVAALVASGCGSDNSTDTASTAAKTAATQTTSAASSATVSTKSSGLGTILAGSGGKTLYMFESDKNGKSSCSSDCQAVWPPAIATGKVTVSGDADQSKIGSVSGTKQITYAGHPLYYYVKDTDEEDVYGNDLDSFGAEWYALTPAGSEPEDKGEKSESSESSSDDSGSMSSGY